MDFPVEFKYTKDHEWLFLIDNSTARIGMSAYALKQLGDVVYLELPEVGAVFNGGEVFATIESTKTVSDIYMPIGGKICKVNDLLANSNFENFNQNPYDQNWLVEIEVLDLNEQKQLLSSEEYKSYIEGQEQDEDKEEDL